MRTRMLAAKGDTRISNGLNCRIAAVVLLVDGTARARHCFNSNIRRMRGRNQLIVRRCIHLLERIIKFLHAIIKILTARWTRHSHAASPLCLLITKDTLSLSLASRLLGRLGRPAGLV